MPDAAGGDLGLSVPIGGAVSSKREEDLLVKRAVFVADEDRGDGVGIFHQKARVRCIRGQIEDEVCEK